MTDNEFVNNSLLDYTSSSDILPFCVYYWINPKESIYRAYLSGPSIVKSKDTFKYKCVPPKSINPYGNWTLGFTFYAANPMIRPIPAGMALFCAERNSSFPWNTRSVRMVYDPYDINNKCVYFIAYRKPVPWTKPLFVHVEGSDNITENCFPSWDPNPPVTNQKGKYVRVDSTEIVTQPIHKWVGDTKSLSIIESGKGIGRWKHAKIFPFYVLSPDLFGPEYENIKFICHDAYCFPYNPHNDYVDNESLSLNKPLGGSKETPTTLTECVIKCNQLVPQELGGGKPYNMLGMVNEKLRQLSVESPNIGIGTKISNISPIIITILVTVLVVSVGVLVYISIRKK